ncbi:hypothetical protein FM107_01505 [Sphingobacterium sp. JB170]|nr:hypothetical protein FM107_01505 [Sphingobacterium sp. JB170]
MFFICYICIKKNRRKMRLIDIIFDTKTKLPKLGYTASKTVYVFNKG